MGTKRTLTDVIIICALITILLIRLFSNNINPAWIQFINFAGLIIAFISLYMECLLKFKIKQKFAFLTGIFTLLLVILIVFAILLLLSVINLNSKINDCIMITTLLITLPTRFYIRFFNKILNK